ncbi:hypothetical protein [Streptomyces luteireticuli]|uniref:hypothetical protein n=1 Tax=Streptomyces luteireticuli TaxID=173858 RepID=UPI0035571B04
MAIASCGVSRRRRLRPYDQAWCALVYVYLCNHAILEQTAACFAIGMVAWRYANDTFERLTQFMPSLTETLTNRHAYGYVPLDGTVAETDTGYWPKAISPARLAVRG